jgi:hypothetical protein
MQMLFILSTFFPIISTINKKKRTREERQGKVRKKRQKERGEQTKGNHLEKE